MPENFYEILRFREAKISNPKYKIDKRHKILQIEAQHFWNKPEQKSDRKKYWKYAFHKIVIGLSQEEMFGKFFLSDAIVKENASFKIANTLVMCMGATGKGKSYTIFGLKKSYENRGFALRVISTLFQLKAKYDSCHVDIYMSAVEHFNNQCYDLLDPSKGIVHNRREVKTILTDSEEGAVDLVYQIDSNRSVSKGGKDKVHHTSSVAVEIHVEISCERTLHRCQGNIFLVDLEAFDHTQADNVKDMYALNKKFMNIRNFSAYLIKLIGTTDATIESNDKTKSLICSMKSMHKFIDNNAREKSSVFTQEVNIDFLKISLQNRIDEMHGLIKLVKDQQKRNEQEIRGNLGFMKNLILAYVYDKIELLFILNMNVAPDFQFIYDACLSLYESVKEQFDFDLAEVEKKAIFDYLKMEEEKKVRLDNMKMEESSFNEDKEDSEMLISFFKPKTPSKLKVKSKLKIEPFDLVWKEFLKAKAEVKVSFDFYRNQMNTYQNQLNLAKKEMASKNMTYYERELLRAKKNNLEAQMTLIRKKIVQAHNDHYKEFMDFCEEKNFVALPNNMNDIKESSSPLFEYPCKISKSTPELQSVDLEEFHNYLRLYDEFTSVCSEI